MLFIALNVLVVIGDTGRRLGDRICEHLYDVRNNDSTKPVSRHFNLSNTLFQILLFSAYLWLAATMIAAKPKRCDSFTDWVHLIPMG